MGKPQPWVLPMTLVCLALGALAAVLTRAGAADDDIGPSPDMPLDKQVVMLQRKNKEIQAELAKQKGEYDRLVSAKTDDPGLMQKIDDLRALAATSALEGPGIVITIDDSKNGGGKSPGVDDTVAGIVHDFDLQLLVNELRAAGAEGMAINDERVGPRSAIRCVGPAINVNSRPVSAPFIIKAIGKPDTLFGAINLPHGIADNLRNVDIRVDVEKKDKISLPPVQMPTGPSVGRVVADPAAGGS